LHTSKLKIKLIAHPNEQQTLQLSLILAYLA